MTKYIISFLSIALLFTACEKDPVETRTDREIIIDYLADNSLTAEETSSGLFYIHEELGTGNSPTITDVVEVRYTGSFTSDEVFDNTVGDNTTTFALTNVIPGFSEGIRLMKKGGKTKLLMPSNLGYGNNPPNGIPRNAVLIFDVELVNF